MTFEKSVELLIQRHTALSQKGESRYNQVSEDIINALLDYYHKMNDKIDALNAELQENKINANLLDFYLENFVIPQNNRRNYDITVQELKSVPIDYIVDSYERAKLKITHLDGSVEYCNFDLGITVKYYMMDKIEKELKELKKTVRCYPKI